MRKLNAAVDRFAYNHPRFGIPNLMRVIVAGNVLVYLLAIFAGYGPISFLMFDWSAITQGELWRLVTFIFMPGYYSTSDVLWLALFLYFYYMIGTVLEREWGTPKFSLYYLSGVVLTILVGALTALISGSNVLIAGTGYVNLSMFFAFCHAVPGHPVPGVLHHPGEGKVAGLDRRRLLCPVGPQQSGAAGYRRAPCCRWWPC